MLQNKKFTFFTEGIMKKSLTNAALLHFRPFHKQKATIPTFLFPAVVARSPLQSQSADSLMIASVIRNPSVKFKTIMIL
jgi:hypothetical protein